MNGSCAAPCPKPCRSGRVELANELGVDEFPLRDALARLEQEGLIASQADRGYTVLPMSAAQAEKIHALRLAVEPVVDDADRTVAQAAYDRLDAAVAIDDLGDAAVCNREFHTALVRPGGRSPTTGVVQRSSVPSERHVVARLRPPGREDRAHVDAWPARDAAGVRALPEGHLDGTLRDPRGQFVATGR